MPIPEPVFDPPFRITRCSHVVIGVTDLAASKTFYTEVAGLVLTHASDDTLYFRGIEEACHHSLVLRKSSEPQCLRLGMRVLTEADLDRAKDTFEARGCVANWVEVAHQGRTLHVTDPLGLPLELCARMPVMPRMIMQFPTHRGGAAQRIDHYQILVPDVAPALAYYMSLGFRLSEYFQPQTAPHPTAVFLQRKGNPHDIVFFTGKGPRLHHFAFLVPEMHHLLHACDVAGALGFGHEVERGPARHGPGHAMYVYMRDPDGHRIELFNTHYQIMDLENEPVRWDPATLPPTYPWGLPARRKWFEEATPFAATPMSEPKHPPHPMTLERYLGVQSS